MSKKISELDPIDRITGLEEFPVRLGTSNFRMKVSDITGFFTKERIGLGRVDNTTDAEKPVSGPQQTALDGKVNTIDFNTLSQTMAGKANTQHTHELSEINGLVDRFDSITTGLNTLGNRITVTEGYIVQLTTRINDIVVPTSFDISAVNGLTAVIQDHSSRIDSKADSAHSHTANSITGLTTFVNTVLGTKTYASVGTSDW